MIVPLEEDYEEEAVAEEFSEEDKDKDSRAEKDREEMKKRISNCSMTQELPWVMLPHDGMLVSEFAKDVASILKPINTIFYRQDLKKIVEISKITSDSIIEGDKTNYTGFNVVEAKRFVSLIENHMVPMAQVFDKREGCVINKRRTLLPVTADITLSSDALITNINTINRIFNVPIPIMYQGSLTFPKNGFDERFNSWLPYDAPTIDTNMSLEDAKKIINDIYSEFCFKSNIDRDIAISALITPGCRGLFKSFTTRTPVFLYKANRERCGKDYCAGITGILYEGVANEDGPLSSGDKDNNNSYQTGQKIFAAMIGGRKRMHFANCRGMIENAAFEQAVTGEVYTGRILGKTQTLTCNNEIDFSLSANIGISYNGDFANRCRTINLFLDIEDANSRKFKTPDLHGYIKDNRGKILSAIYTLINDWVSKGSKEGDIPFASFHKWSEVVGGIMVNAGYSNPCVTISDNDIGGDEETMKMKKLYESMSNLYGSSWITKEELHTAIQNDQILQDLFPLSSRSDATTLGLLLKKFNGRIQSNIKFYIDDRAARHKYKFNKLEDKQVTL